MMDYFLDSCGPNEQALYQLGNNFCYLIKQNIPMFGMANHSEPNSNNYWVWIVKSRESKRGIDSMLCPSLSCIDPVISYPCEHYSLHNLPEALEERLP